jgi:hypothetical protein
MDDRDTEDWVAMYLTYESEDTDYPPSRAERREAQRERQRRGMVKHGPGSARAPKRPKPHITVKG